MPHLIVFTDLDGSLLDGTTYSYEAATPAITALREQSIPLVLVSGKTRAEMEPLRERLGHDDAFIVESGGAALVPPGLFDLALRGMRPAAPHQGPALAPPQRMVAAGSRQISA